MLIIPALIILKHAGQHMAEEFFIAPKMAIQEIIGQERTEQTRETALHIRMEQTTHMQKSVTSVNFSGVHILTKPKSQRCFDNIWTGSCHDTCHTFNTLARHKQRKQQVLVCEKSKVQLKTLYTTKQKYVHKVPFKDPCLRKVVDRYCHDDKKVPNIVHYIWFGKAEFKFVHFLSFLSAHKFQNPCIIMVHADKLPVGYLWSYFLQISSKVLHVKRQQPKSIFKNKITLVEQKADIAKLEALKEYGGMYLDTDHILLKSLDPYRNFDATIGLDYKKTAANSIVISKRDSMFIKIWYETYHSFSNMDGNKHSQITPYKLSQKHKDLVHVVEDLLLSPNPSQLASIYSTNVTWSDKYGMHLHFKLHDKFNEDTLSFESIKFMSSTVGTMARHILYGVTDSCSTKSSNL